MLNCFIAHGGEHGTQVEIGCGQRRWRVEVLERAAAQDIGLVDEGTGATVQRWRRTTPAHHHSAGLVLALGSRCWLFSRDWPNPRYNSAEAKAERQQERQVRLARLTPVSEIPAL